MKKFDTTQHVKIWFCRQDLNPRLHFLGSIINEYRLISHIENHPGHKIHLVVCKACLTRKGIRQLNSFCEKYSENIILVDIEDIGREIKDLPEDENKKIEQELFDFAKKEIFDECGCLAAASDLARTLTPVLRRGIYTDFDREAFFFLPDEIYIPDNVEIIFPDNSNDLIAVADRKLTSKCEMARAIRRRLHDNYCKIDQELLNDIARTARHELLESDLEKPLRQVLASLIPNDHTQSYNAIDFRQIFQNKAADLKAPEDLYKKFLRLQVMCVSGPCALYKVFPKTHDGANKRLSSETTTFRRTNPRAISDTAWLSDKWMAQSEHYKKNLRQEKLDQKVVRQLINIFYYFQSYVDIPDQHPELSKFSAFWGDVLQQQKHKKSKCSKQYLQLEKLLCKKARTALKDLTKPKKKEHLAQWVWMFKAFLENVIIENETVADNKTSTLGRRLLKTLPQHDCRLAYDKSYYGLTVEDCHDLDDSNLDIFIYLVGGSGSWHANNRIIINSGDIRVHEQTALFYALRHKHSYCADALIQRGKRDLSKKELGAYLNASGTWPEANELINTYIDFPFLSIEKDKGKEREIQAEWIWSREPTVKKLFNVEEVSTLFVAVMTGDFWAAIQLIAMGAKVKSNIEALAAINHIMFNHADSWPDKNIKKLLPKLLEQFTDAQEPTIEMMLERDSKKDYRNLVSSKQFCLQGLLYYNIERLAFLQKHIPYGSEITNYFIQLLIESGAYTPAVYFSWQERQNENELLSEHQNRVTRKFFSFLFTEVPESAKKESPDDACIYTKPEWVQFLVDNRLQACLDAFAGMQMWGGEFKKQFQPLTQSRRSSCIKYFKTELAPSLLPSPSLTKACAPQQPQQHQQTEGQKAKKKGPQTSVVATHASQEPRRRLSIFSSLFCPLPGTPAAERRLIYDAIIEARHNSPEAPKAYDKEHAIVPYYSAR